jgi:tripartite-type tricarboxylate transporter receptor subunit TctC
VLSMNGIVVAGGTPRALVNRLNADFRKLLARPDVGKRMQDFGVQVVGDSPEEFGQFIRKEIERWTRVAKAANIKLDQ